MWDLPRPRIEHVSLALADCLPLSHQGSPNVIFLRGDTLFMIVSWVCGIRPGVRGSINIVWLNKWMNKWKKKLTKEIYSGKKYWLCVHNMSCIAQGPWNTSVKKPEETCSSGGGVRQCMDGRCRQWQPRSVRSPTLMPAHPALSPLPATCRTLLKSYLSLWHFSFDLRWLWPAAAWSRVSVPSQRLKSGRGGESAES